MKNAFLISLFLLSSTAFGQVLDDTAVNLTFSGRLIEHKALPVVSYATTDIHSAAGNLVHITGSSTITSFGVPAQGGEAKTVIFDNAPLLTHNASTLALPGSANIQAAAGDIAEVVADSTSKWIVKSYSRASGVPLISSAQRSAAVVIASSDTLLAADVIGSGIFTNANNVLITSTLPLGASIAAAKPGYAVGDLFEVVFVNTGNSTQTIAANTGASIVGLATIPTLTSGTFLGRFSAADTVIFYRK